MSKLTQWVMSVILAGLSLSLPLAVLATRTTPFQQSEPVQHSVMGMLRKGTNGFQLTMLGTYGKVFYFSDQQVRNGEVILMSPFRTAPSGALLVHATLKTNTNGATQVIAVDLPPEPPHVYSPFTHFSVKMNIWYNKLCDTVDDVVVSRPYGQY